MTTLQNVILKLALLPSTSSTVSLGFPSRGFFHAMSQRRHAGLAKFKRGYDAPPKTCLSPDFSKSGLFHARLGKQSRVGLSN